MSPVGCNLSKRFQNESALVHRRMGTLEFRRADDGIAEEQDVEIDVAWAFGLDAVAAHRLLDLLDFRQEFLRREFGNHGDRAVQERRLLR